MRVEHGGTRVDKFIAEKVSQLSRAFAQKLIQHGQVTVNGQVPKASYRLEVGDLLEVRVPAPEPSEAGAEDIPLNVIFEDGDLIVVDKPAGMVVHPAYGHRSGTLVNALLGYCPDLAGVAGELRPGIVHRLDKDTSGLIVVAKNDAAHRHLQHQFKERLVDKMYLALAEGRLPSAHGLINAPIGRDPRNRKRMAVVLRGGREALTEYVVREYFPDHTLAAVKPVTGRTHQIRIHFASIGHPLAGDRVYGYRKQQLPLRRHFLHAASLAFSLPGSTEQRTFRADLPEDLAQVLDALRQTNP